MRQSHDTYHKGGMLTQPAYEQHHAYHHHHSSINPPAQQMASYSTPYIDQTAYYARPQPHSMRQYTAQSPHHPRSPYSPNPKAYPRQPAPEQQYFPPKQNTRGHSPSPYYPQEAQYAVPSTPPTYATTRPRVSDYTASGEFTQRGYPELPAYQYHRGEPHWSQPHAPQAYPPRMMSGPLPASQNQYMQFSGKFSITPDPGNYIEEEWQDVVARHSRRRGRSAAKQHLKGGRPEGAQAAPRGEGGMGKLQTQARHSGRQEASPAPSLRNSVLPDDFQQAYEETCREMDAMQNAFREALSVYGDDVGEGTNFELDDLKNSMTGFQVASTAMPEAGSTIPYRNESMPQLPAEREVSQPTARSLYDGQMEAGLQPRLLPYQQEALVAAAAANFGQTSAPNLTVEMEQEYAAEQSANNAKVLEWL